MKLTKAQQSSRRRWWLVAWALGGTQSDIAQLSNVSRQSVHEYLSKFPEYRGRQEITLRELRDYRAIYDKFTSHLDYLSPVEAAEFIQEKASGVAQGDLLADHS